MMRALSIRPPWDWAITDVQDSPKRVENRTRNFTAGHRGLVALHTSANYDANAVLHSVFRDALKRAGVTTADLKARQRGAVTAVFDLIDVHNGPSIGSDAPGTCWRRRPSGPGWVAVSDGPCSPWGQLDTHHLVIGAVHVLPEPVNVPGRLGLWTLPADVEAAVRRQVRL